MMLTDMKVALFFIVVAALNLGCNMPAIDAVKASSSTKIIDEEKLFRNLKKSKAPTESPSTTSPSSTKSPTKSPTKSSKKPKGGY
jgi:hypothetical protein